MTTAKIEIEVPVGMTPYLTADRTSPLRRNALLLYPFIWEGKISHGKAAEILGMNKLDLIDLYEEMGFSYLDLTMDELSNDVATLRRL
ncbi:MAG: UPF0175 family protein [Oscillospiraceae bacterium]|nr:UPF0175 family protein [Oscillospiraceae bacterium]